MEKMRWVERRRGERCGGMIWWGGGEEKIAVCERESQSDWQLQRHPDGGEKRI